MAYNELTRDSGGSADDRLSEARRLLRIIGDLSQDTPFTPSEFKFLKEIHEHKNISAKQLFWLRDIKDKYL